MLVFSEGYIKISSVVEQAQKKILCIFAGPHHPNVKKNLPYVLRRIEQTLVVGAKKSKLACKVTTCFESSQLPSGKLTWQ